MQRDNPFSRELGGMRFRGNVTGRHLPVRLHSLRCALAIACLAWCGGSQPAWGSQATVTTLSLASGGNAVSSVAGGTVVTLTAAIQAGAATLKIGQVNFCDATAASCTDIHLAGTVPLTSAGTAVLRFRPGPGSHSCPQASPSSRPNIRATRITVRHVPLMRPPSLSLSNPFR